MAPLLPPLDQTDELSNTQHSISHVTIPSKRQNRTKAAEASGTNSRTIRLLVFSTALVLGLGALGYRLGRPRPNLDRLLVSAKAAIQSGDEQTATQTLDQLLSLAPNHGQALLYRGQLAFDQRDDEAAYEYFRRVPDSPPAMGCQARYAEGVLLVKQGYCRAGETLLQQAVSLDPSAVASRERLVELYLAQMRTGEVRKQLEAIRYVRPWTIDELVLYTIVGSQPGDRQGGPAQIAQFLKTVPDDPPLQLALARYRLMDGRQSEAIELATPLLNTVTYSAQAAALIADSQMEQHDFASAAHTIGQLAYNSEPHAAAFRSCGRLAIECQDWQTAVKCYARAARFDRENLETAHRLGIALSRCEDARAERQLEHASRLDHLLRQASRLPNRDANTRGPMVSIMQDVADTLIRLGRPRAAAYWYDQILMMDSTNAEARGKMAIALNAASGNFSDASDRLLDGIPTISWQAMLAYAQSKVTDKHYSNLEYRNDEAAIELRDVHEQASLTFEYFNGNTTNKYLLESMGGGVAVLDYDMDGWSDVYVTQGCRMPYKPSDVQFRDRLFRNLGNGAFQDVSESAGLGCNSYGQGCASSDFNNDGYTDIVVGNYGSNVLYKNNGDGTFTDVTNASRVAGDEWTASLGFADFNGDGNLDLYVVNYLDSLRVCRGVDGRIAACDPQNFNGQQDRLFVSNGDGTFVDRTLECGIEATGGKGLGLLLADLDLDGWMDIYVANDGTPNFLFRNMSDDTKLRFEEIGLAAGAAVNGSGQSEGGMGIAFGDLNGDGLEDLYVTNFLDETNTLYQNLGTMLFKDVSHHWGTDRPSKPMVGFGTQTIDLDLDGDLDLFVANGHIDDFRFRNEPWKMKPQVFLNSGSHFLDVSSKCGEYFQHQGLGRGVAKFDWDNDGDDDLLVVDQSRPLALLSNETRLKGNWIAFRLIGRTSSRDAIGARMAIQCGGKFWHQSLASGNGYYSSNERTLRFGLGRATTVESCTIIWPDGQVQQIEMPSVGSLNTIVQPPAQAMKERQ